MVTVLETCTIEKKKNLCIRAHLFVQRKMKEKDKSYFPRMANGKLGVWTPDGNHWVRC